MTALTTLDLILLGLGAWLLLAALIALGVGALIRGPRPDFDAQGKERVGLLEADRAKRREQVERAVARHKIQTEKQRREAA